MLCCVYICVRSDENIMFDLDIGGFIILEL